MKRPWMPLYVADYLADTAHLGATESGAYLHLIMHYWLNGGLPDDERQLARIARMSDRQWSSAAATLRAFFHDGWKHKRVDAELAKATAISGKRRASANKRHGKTDANAGANAEQLDTHARATSQSQSQSKSPEANASDARASPAQPPPPDDPRTKLFRESLGMLARITGKTPDSCRSLVGRWLKLSEDEAIHVVAAIEDADRNGVADPTAWIAQRLNAQFRGGRNGRRDDDGKSLLAAIERQNRRLGPGEVDYQPRLDPVLSLPAR